MSAASTKAPTLDELRKMLPEGWTIIRSAVDEGVAYSMWKHGLGIKVDHDCPEELAFATARIIRALKEEA